ncbi:hypothetical protein Vretifemale_20814, partial [Volvox reticuliferus]
ANSLALNESPRSFGGRDACSASVGNVLGVAISGAKGCKRSSLELAITLAASAGGKSFSNAGLRPVLPTPSLTLADDRTPVSTQSRDVIENTSRLSAFVPASFGNCGGGSAGCGCGSGSGAVGCGAAAANSANCTRGVEAASGSSMASVLRGLGSGLGPAEPMVAASIPIDPWDTAEGCSELPDVRVPLLHDLNLDLSSTFGVAAVQALAGAPATRADAEGLPAADKETWPVSVGLLADALPDGNALQGNIISNARCDDGGGRGGGGGGGGGGGDGGIACITACSVEAMDLECLGILDTAKDSPPKADASPWKASAFDPRVARLLDVGGVPLAPIPQHSPLSPLPLRALPPAQGPPSMSESPAAASGVSQPHEPADAIATAEVTGGMAAEIVSPSLIQRAAFPTPLSGQHLLHHVLMTTPAGSNSSPAVVSGSRTLRSSSHPRATLTGVPEAEEGFGSSSDLLVAVPPQPLLTQAERPPSRRDAFAAASAPLPAAAVDKALIWSPPPADHPNRPCTMDERSLCWHEVTASPFIDPVTGQRMLLLVQADVTSRVEAERKLVELTAAQTGMLEQMFPRHVLEFVAQHGEALGGMDFSANVEAFATSHDMATVLFAEIVGFTAMSKMVPAAAVMSFLSELYSKLDALVDQYGVWKVETAGDCYIVAAGVVRQDADGFRSVVASHQYHNHHRRRRRHHHHHYHSSKAMDSSSHISTHSDDNTSSKYPMNKTADIDNYNGNGNDINPPLRHPSVPACRLSPHRESPVAAQQHQGSLSSLRLLGRASDLLSADYLSSDYMEQLRAERGGTCTPGGPHMQLPSTGRVPVAAADAEGHARRDAESVFRFAVAMLEAARDVRMPHNGEPVLLRVGLHSGPLVSGVIGTKMPKFALFGDTMNTASRMESTCKPGCIQVSGSTRELLPGVALQPTGGVLVKGKGVMETYVFVSPFAEAAAGAGAGATIATPLDQTPSQGR